MTGPGVDRGSPRRAEHDADLGDLVMVLLAGNLAALRDRLSSDGFGDAADVVADLVDIIDDYVSRRGA